MSAELPPQRTSQKRMLVIEASDIGRDIEIGADEVGIWYSFDAALAYAAAAVAAEREQRARTMPDLRATAALIVDACGGPDDALPHVVAALQTLVEGERERCAKLLDAAHEQRKHLDNYAAHYARMIRECRLIDPSA